MARFSKGIEVITLWVAVDDYGNPSAIPDALDFIVPAVEGMGDKGISLIDYDSEVARLVMQPGRWKHGDPLPVAKEDSGKGTDDA
jgi:hypothetical protein